MEDLKKLIHDHSEAFNDAVPSDGHFERFEDRLNQRFQKRMQPASNRIWMRVAAGLVILVTATFAFIALFTQDFSGREEMQAAVLDLPEEMQEILYFYQQRTALQMAELNQVMQSCDNGSQLINRTTLDLEQYDQQIAYLVKMAKTQPDNDRVQNALIQQYKAKETIINDAILLGKIKKCAP